MFRISVDEFMTLARGAIEPDLKTVGFVSDGKHRFVRAGRWKHEYVEIVERASGLLLNVYVAIVLVDDEVTEQSTLAHESTPVDGQCKVYKCPSTFMSKDACINEIRADCRGAIRWLSNFDSPSSTLKYIELGGDCIPSEGSPVMGRILEQLNKMNLPK